jgi:peptidoglycan hydrolase-like protein with peptidoglycan-binding domain
MKTVAAAVALAFAVAGSADAQSTKSKELEPDLKPGHGTSQAVDPAGTSRPAAQGSGARIEAIQQALKDKGLDPGPVDGLMGAKTIAAVRELQKKEGLQPTGRLDAQTLDRLGLAKDQATVSASPSSERVLPTEQKKEGPGASTTTPQAEQARDTDAQKKADKK